MANQACYSTVLKPEDDVLSLSNVYQDDSSTWPQLSEQQEPKQIAENKLKRQNERILQNDQAMASINTNKTKGRSRAKFWKPFDLKESSDEQGSSDETSRSAYADPYTISPSSQPFAISEYPQVAAALLPITDYENWQQHDALRYRPLVSGLNAYQVPATLSTPTVAATYDKHEIDDIFGNELPSPSYCSANTGKINGQVQFCIHPNGDVSAHQWSGSLYQWINIGQYSNIRKKTEGQMANERLIGETESQSLQQNTLAYFRLVAKQREAQVTGTALGLQEIKSALLNSQSRTARFRDDTTPPVDKENVTPGEKYNSFGTTSNKTKSRIISHETLVHTPTPLFVPRSDNLGSRSLLRSRLADLKFGSMPASQMFPYSLQSRMHSTPDLGPVESERGLLERSMSFPTQAGTQRDTLISSRPPKATMTPEALPFHPRYGTTTSQLNHQTRFETVPSRSHSALAIATPAIFGQVVSTQAGRGSYRDALQKAAERDTASKPPRSVDSAIVSYKIGHDGPSQLEQAGFEPIIDQTVPLRPQLFEGDELAESWPGPRPSSLGDATFALTSVPTQQNFDGPFFMGADELKDPKIKDERYHKDLTEWFHGGRVKAERHDDLCHHIMTEANTSNTTSTTDPGAIGPSEHKDSTAVKGPKYDETATRLFIPVIENLRSLAEDLKADRKSRAGRPQWDARYIATPEWCIDKSDKGKLSFWDDNDWVQPPPRIGRDQRYAPITNKL